MDTLAPQSILDSRKPEGLSSYKILPDRLTRAQSPGRLAKRPSQEDLEEVLLSRIDQPYRTSFSAVTTPIKTKRQRSRSASPGASSMKSEKSTRGSNKTGKHVTYNTNVTVRHSDSFENHDSLDTYTLEQDQETPDRKTEYKMADYSTRENRKETQQKKETVNDYSSQIRKVTQMIVNEYSNDKSNNESDVSVNVTSSPKQYLTKPPLPGKGRGRGRGTPNGRPMPHPSQVKPKNVLAWEYEHDQTVTYKKAVSSHYSDDLKNVAMESNSASRLDDPDTSHVKTEQASVQNTQTKHSANPEPRMERSSSMPLQPQEDTTRLSPPKRTVSGSIGNFFRKLSPRLGRKNKKDRSCESVSTLSDSGHGGCGSDESLSRNRLRQSFNKLLGRGSPKTKNRKKLREGSSSSLPKSDIESLNDEPRTRQIPSSSNRMMESIKQNSDRDKDVYQKFKERQSPNRPSDVQNAQPIRVSGEVTPPNRPSQADKDDYNSSLSQDCYDYDQIGAYDVGRQMTAIPDIVKDVTHMSPNSPDQSLTSPDLTPTSKQDTRRGQSGSPKSRSYSTDESIGNCLFDIDYTVSEPSLSNTDTVDSPAGHSRRHRGDVITLASERPLSPLAASTPAIPSTKTGRRTQSEPTQENGLYFSSMPKLADSGDLPLSECTKSPSYLKLSCAVSGYGKYSQYSSYRDIEKRSPYSSVSSSRSDLLSPDMPVTRVTSPSVPRTNSERGCEFGLISPQPLSLSSQGSHGDLANGDNICNSVTNGSCNGVDTTDHLSEDSYPTGDPKLDGAYFLRLTQSEENSIISHCQQVEADLQSGDLPEEANGKIRAAIGKANLLISQKCKQFQELCMEHIEPSEDGKLLKWEDLQGFWDMIKLQIDSVYRMFTEIELLRQNGWKELTVHSQQSSVNSSPKSGSLSLSNASTPSGTPGSKRRVVKVKETPESSPERTEKMRAAARAREEARKRMLAEKRAAMRQKQQQKEVEIFVAESGK